jgi:hypothetical protein
MPRGTPAKVMGIWLKRVGDDIVITGEDIYGHEVELIREHFDGPISHNISEHGINQRFNDEYWRRSNQTVAEHRQAKR